MAAKYEIKKARNGQFVFNLKSGNGQVVLTSEMYKQKKSALNGINSIRKNGDNDKRFERKMAKNGKPYFTIKARNGEVIGSSQMYASKRSMEKGIASVKNNCADAVTKDLTA